MQKLTALNPISTPLNSVVLIEASAGTGKTYTIASLYLRLLLQAGENCFSQPLTVEQILVVTFTEAATQELKERIRNRIHLAKSQLLAYRETQDKAVFIGTDNEILAELVETIPDLNAAIQRLHIAEQNMDLAAIYTIHGFCRRILTQYAFHSGLPFHLELVKDESDLLLHLCRECWRTHFYPQPLLISQFLQKKFTSPEALLPRIKSYIQGEHLNVSKTEKSLLQGGLTVFFQQHLQTDLTKIIKLKQQWQQSAVEIRDLLMVELAKPSKEKRIKGSSFKSNTVPNWLEQIDVWATNPLETDLPECLSKYFSQANLIENYTPEGRMPLQHALFEQVDEVKSVPVEFHEKIILYHYIQWVRQQVIEYKRTRSEKNFNDLLRLADEALRSEKGDELASLLRQQYPFAMIDEFQDTDAMQYRIFSKLYTQTTDTGFIMIGDPKQAIYKFRGADINSYLQAADQAKVRFNLDKNYRSSGKLIEVVNQLFHFQQKPPFLYEDIGFSPVGVGKKSQTTLQLKGQPQAALIAYLEDEKASAAEICASAICQLLTEKATLVGEQYNALQPQHIAVLVRNRFEAEEIKQALQKCRIASVYLSDKRSVFNSQIAQSLVAILQACLQPQSEKKVVTALCSVAFVLNSQEMLQLKQDENQLETWLTLFEQYHKTWQFSGVLPMLYQLLHRKNSLYPHSMAERLMNLPDGERLLTDFLHLAELLHQAANQQQTEAGLITWLEKQIQSQDNEQEEQQLRLESEQEVVKIVTIHKSKGLEYEVVWLPFIARDLSKDKAAQDIATYYDKNAQAIQWDMQSNHQALVQQERFAEEMRLLYVALTRAKQQIGLVLPEEFTSNNKWTALLYALTEGEIGTNFELKDSFSNQSLLEKWQQKCGENSIEIAKSTPMFEGEYRPDNEDIHFTANRFQGNIEKDWQVASFTGLLYSHQYQCQKQREKNPSNLLKSAVKNSDKSHWEEAMDTAHGSKEKLEQDWPDYPPNYSPVDFPNGIQVGVALHSFFEKQPFHQPISAESLNRLCSQLQLSEQWQVPLAQWLNHILKTPLAENGVTLRQLSPATCLKELQFYLKINDTFSVEKFNRTLQQFHRFEGVEFAFEQIKGVLRGFIDLVFYHQGQYYLVDYKSNLLGLALQDYHQTQLPKVIQKQHYDLQYLLYSVALDRYLQLRDKNYDYEQDFAGVFYCFLRGMDGNSGENGIFRDKPDVRLIHALGELFYA